MRRGFQHPSGDASQRQESDVTYPCSRPVPLLVGEQTGAGLKGPTRLVEGPRPTRHVSGRGTTGSSAAIVLTLFVAISITAVPSQRNAFLKQLRMLRGLASFLEMNRSADWWI